MASGIQDVKGTSNEPEGALIQSGEGHIAVGSPLQKNRDHRKNRRVRIEGVGSTGLSVSK